MNHKEMHLSYNPAKAKSNFIEKEHITHLKNIHTITYNYMIN